MLLLLLWATAVRAQEAPLSATPGGAQRRVCQLAYAADFPLAAALPLNERIGIPFHPHLNLTGPASTRAEDFEEAKHIVGTKLGLSYPVLKPDADYCLVCYAIAHQAQNVTIRLGCHNGPLPPVAQREGLPAFASRPNEYEMGGWESFRRFPGPRIHIFQSLFRSTRRVGGRVLSGHTYDVDACLEGDETGRCTKRDTGAGCQISSYFVAANSPGLLSHQCWMLPLLPSEVR